jgi:hypothetical protein
LGSKQYARTKTGFVKMKILLFIMVLSYFCKYEKEGLAHNGAESCTIIEYLLLKHSLSLSDFKHDRTK